MPYMLLNSLLFLSRIMLYIEYCVGYLPGVHPLPWEEWWRWDHSLAGPRQCWYHAGGHCCHDRWESDTTHSPAKGSIFDPKPCFPLEQLCLNFKLSLITRTSFFGYNISYFLFLCKTKKPKSLLAFSTMSPNWERGSKQLFTGVQCKPSPKNIE